LIKVALKNEQIVVDVVLGDVNMASSITLVTGQSGLHNILVGTGLPSDKHMLLSGKS